MKRLKIEIVRYDNWRWIHLLLSTTIAILLAITTATFLTPVCSPITISETPLNITPLDSNHPSKPIVTTHTENTSKATIRSGFFKSPTPLQRRSANDSVVERILRKLELKYILVIKDEAVGFVKIKDTKGIQTCRIGNNIKDLFRILDIHPNQQCMDIEIAGQKVVLRK